MTNYDVSYLQQLITFNTVSGTSEHAAAAGTHALASYLSDFLLEHGLTVLEIPSGEGHYSILGLSPERLTNDTPDLGLLLSGHYDVVPFKRADWQSDPLTLTLREGRYYGRGCADMKGFLSCMLQLVTTKAQISYLFTCEEETSMAGAQSVAALLTDPSPARCAGVKLRMSLQTLTDPAQIAKQLSILRGRKFALTVIGEPTEMQPILGHKGWLARDLIIPGEEGHGSRSPQCYSAMQSLPTVLTQLEHLSHELAAYSDPRFSIAPSTLSLGTIKGGQSYNTICAEITLGFEVRPTPKLPLAKLQQLLDQCLSAINQQLPPAYPVTLSAPYPDTPAFPEEHGAVAPNADQARYRRYVQLLSPQLQRKYQDAQESSYVAYCTEASWLQVITHECIIMGPGSINDAHQANEGIAVSELEECWATLQRLCAQEAH